MKNITEGFNLTNRETAIMQRVGSHTTILIENTGRSLTDSEWQECWSTPENKIKFDRVIFG